MMDPWWNEQAAGWIGGVGGASIGILGGVIGTVTGICAPRGKCKRMVLTLYCIGIAIGVGLLLAGVAALLLSQPYAVFYPLLLTGGITVPILSALLPTVFARYREADKRRLQAEELRRS